MLIVEQYVNVSFYNRHGCSGAAVPKCDVFVHIAWRMNLGFFQCLDFIPRETEIRKVTVIEVGVRSGSCSDESRK
jgi:hypothetical protein